MLVQRSSRCVHYEGWSAKRASRGSGSGGEWRCGGSAAKARGRLGSEGIGGPEGIGTRGWSAERRCCRCCCGAKGGCLSGGTKGCTAEWRRACCGRRLTKQAAGRRRRCGAECRGCCCAAKRRRCCAREETSGRRRGTKRRSRRWRGTERRRRWRSERSRGSAECRCTTEHSLFIAVRRLSVSRAHEACVSSVERRLGSLREVSFC